MAYSPHAGWGELTEQQAVDFREALRMELRIKVPRLLEGCKLVCIPDFNLSDMKRPVMVVHTDFDMQAFCDALNAAGVDFPPMQVSRSPYVPTDTVTFMETAQRPMALQAWL